MSTKSNAEKKSSELLRMTMPYTIKIPDGQGWGGKPRLDFLGECSLGHFLAVEVKAVTPRVRAPLIFRHTDPKVMTVPQKQAFEQMRKGKSAHLWVWVWVANELFAYHWGLLRGWSEPVDLRQHVELGYSDYFNRQGTPEWPHDGYPLVERMLGHGI